MSTQDVLSNFVIKKHNDLVKARYSLSLPSFRILTYILSLIRADDTEFHKYKIYLHDMANGLNISLDNQYRFIDSVTDELLKLVVKIPLKEGGFEKFQWFSRAKYYKGKGYCIFQIHRDMRPYLLELKELFTQYDFRNLENLKSVNHRRLFELIVLNKFRGQGYFSVNEIQDILELSASYTPNEIKRRLIEPVKKKAEERQIEVNFDFAERKKPRSKKVIGFDFKNIRAQETKWSLQMTLAESKVIEQPKPENLPPTTKKESTVNPDYLKYLHSTFGTPDQEAQEFLKKYSEEQLKPAFEVLQASKTDEIANVFGWLTHAIKKGYKPQKTVRADKSVSRQAPKADDSKETAITEALKEVEKQKQAGMKKYAEMTNAQRLKHVFPQNDGTNMVFHSLDEPYKQQAIEKMYKVFDEIQSFGAARTKCRKIVYALNEKQMEIEELEGKNESTFEQNLNYF